MTDKERTLKNAARYLMMPSAECGGEALLRAYDEALALSKPAFVYRRVSVIVDGGTVALSGIPPLACASLAGLLKGSREALIVLITLGADIDMRVRRLMVSDPARGVEVSACAGAYADAALDARLRELADGLRGEGLRLTPRISPGYGDLPLELQVPLLAALNADKIGVRLTSGLMMLPEKSVSAIMGLVDINDAAERGARGCDGGAGCAVCPRTDCPYRNE